MLEEAENLTRANTRLTLIVAFNYGSRQEIAAAARALAQEVAAGLIAAADIDETRLARHLDTAGIPDPDLIIRTSGEQRLSNFLMWQAAYSEFIFLPCTGRTSTGRLFRRRWRNSARERRFGGVNGADENGKARK